jgi:hypothetical protein
MSFNDASDRKRKPTNIVPETVSSNDEGRNPKERKSRRVSTDASASTAASLQVVTENAAAANTASAATEHEDLTRSIGKMIEDLFCSDSAKVDALDVLDLYFMRNKKKRELFVTAGGCFVLVQLMKTCLNVAIARIAATDQVAELNELAELTTLRTTLGVITNLTFNHDDSRVGITAVGGVEALVKVMQTFPKCQYLQAYACATLTNLACCSVGKAKAIESGGIQVLLAAINNHLNSSLICERACWVLVSIVTGSKENTGLLITLGGGAAVAKVRTKWPDNDEVQTQVRKLVKIIAADWKAWDDEE